MCTKTKPIKLTDTTVKIYSTIDEVPSDWEVAQPADNCFLHRSYLKVVEASPSINITFSYLIFYKNGFPVGVGFCPLYHYRTRESIRSLREVPEKFEFRRWLKRTLATPLNFNLLIIGNNLLTGEHGFHFHEDYVQRGECINTLLDALPQLISDLKSRGHRTHGYFIKDLEENRQEERNTLLKRNFHEFTFQPNMYMPIWEEWETFDDYLSCMTSKARTRIKKGLKKGKEIEVRELNADQIEALLPEIFNLFRNVADRVSFNMVQLKPTYFLDLKRELGDQFKLYGHFLGTGEDKKMIAFHTAFKKGNIYDAHFLGIDHDYNYSHSLYLNILLNLVKEALASQAEYIVFSRTAMEIKSSIGAEPENLYGYIRARNGLINWFLGRIVRYFEPESDWQPRHPFKDEQ